MQLALEAGEWLTVQGQPQASGVAWPADAFQRDDPAYDLGSGTAGVVVYFLSLYAASGDERFLEMAEEGGVYLDSIYLALTTTIVGGIGGYAMKHLPGLLLDRDILSLSERNDNHEDHAS